MRTELNDWNEVDSALKQLGECDIRLAHIEGEATKKINEIKELAKKEADGIIETRKHVEKMITLFAENHKADFSKKRSKELNFGTVGYRLVKSVSIPRDKEKLTALLKSLKAYGFGECIKYEEKPDKDKIAELSDESIVKLGLKRSVKDSFRVQPKIERIEDAGTSN
jgi:phage host-nuclease inhibitor protein Gam